jgi:hypothetical protein
MNEALTRIKAMVDGGTHLRLVIPTTGTVWMANTALPSEAGPVYAVRVERYQHASVTAIKTTDFGEAWGTLEDAVEGFMEAR